MEKRKSKFKELFGLMDIGFFNSFSTIKTSLHFVKTVFGKGSRTNSLDAIFNYIPISDTIASAGQPHPDQFPAIQAAGFVRVINLAPHGAENAIKNEGELVEKLGMSYIHIPVQFDNPSEADYDAFCQALEEADSNKVFVHCAANMRVSAFLYRYRTQHLSIDPDLAKQDLDKVWKPFGVWADFVTRPQTNRENN